MLSTDPDGAICGETFGMVSIGMRYKYTDASRVGKPKVEFCLEYSRRRLLRQETLVRSCTVISEHWVKLPCMLTSHLEVADAGKGLGKNGQIEI